ncbi:MAG: ATP-binding protein, partial [Chitinispirillales bacterium]|nr:ATP-binding protein [Chitinispirillales bacterium]
IEACLKAKQPLVIDNTNPTVNDRRKYIDMAKNGGFRVIGCYFESDVDAALARNEKRVGKENLPAVAIKSTYSKLESPTFIEGFDELFYVSIDMNGDFIIAAFDAN